MREFWVVIVAGFGCFLAGCQAPGAIYKADAYSAHQVNARQNAVTVEILAVLPAKIQVENAQNKRAAQMVGGVLGALIGGIAGAKIGEGSMPKTLMGGAAGGVAGTVGGSLVAEHVLVDGVSLAYKQDGKVFSSAQVGRLCEFAPGTAIMISTNSTETRIQPNMTCPIASRK